MGKLLSAPLTGYEEAVRSMAWSPDGRTIALTSNRTIRLWPQMVFLSLFLEAIYHQAQLDTSLYVEGLIVHKLNIGAWQALKQQTAD